MGIEWILMLLLYVVVPYGVTALPGYVFWRYAAKPGIPLRGWRLFVVSVLAAILLSPAFVVAAHDPFVLSFWVSLLVENRISPSPSPWNLAVAIVVFSCIFLYRGGWLSVGGIRSRE